MITTAFACVLAVFYLFAGAQKVAAVTAVTSNMARLGVGPVLTRLIGMAEVAGATGVAAGPWIAPLGLVASVGLASLMFGAVIFHAQAGDYRHIGRHRDALAPPLLMFALLALCALLLT